LLLLVAFAAALSAFSYWLGFREGAQVGVMLDVVQRGGLSASYLSKLDQGITRNMVTTFETDVDLALIGGHWVDQHALLPVLEPLWGLPVADARESLPRIARYRKSHSSPLISSAHAAEPGFPDGSELRQNLIAGVREEERILSLMVAKYADDAETAK